MAHPNDTAKDYERTLSKPTDATQFQQPVRVGGHEKMLEADAAESIYARPAPPNEKPTAEDHKAFLDENSVRTVEQAQREETERPKENQDLPDSDGDDGMNPVVKQKQPVAKGKGKK